FTEAEIRPSTSSGRPELVEGRPRPDATATSKSDATGASKADAIAATPSDLENRGVREDRGTLGQSDHRTGSVKPAPAVPIVGSLLVRSTPLGARVLVDGRDYGRTPLTVGNLSRGAHNVRVVRDG